MKPGAGTINRQIKHPNLTLLFIYSRLKLCRELFHMNTASIIHTPFF